MLFRSHQDSFSILAAPAARGVSVADMSLGISSLRCSCVPASAPGGSSGRPWATDLTIFSFMCLFSSQ